ncbi:hypothetical protein OE88DRAFT_1659881 [Heliocybe sulcata]|uniref:Uncharacterized protein n=1 Tax=Heliocybe sulcata TaxID=5364 RepID=A0A5C3MZ82_9AGAM|nr:hypothetical protein OE88DRAFT_1659881 [Heliocybe sulcata]
MLFSLSPSARCSLRALVIFLPTPVPLIHDNLGMADDVPTQREFNSGSPDRSPLYSRMREEAYAVPTHMTRPIPALFSGTIFIKAFGAMAHDYPVHSRRLIPPAVSLKL